MFEEQQPPTIAYSTCEAVLGTLQGFKIDLGERIEEGGTTFYNFFITDGRTLFQLKKRFDEFRILRDEMVAELQNISPTSRPEPSYHIVPVLPDLSIDKVTLAEQNAFAKAKRHDDLKHFLLQILQHSRLSQLVSWRNFLVSSCN